MTYRAIRQTWVTHFLQRFKLVVAVSAFILVNRHGRFGHAVLNRIDC